MNPETPIDVVYVVKFDDSNSLSKAVLRLLCSIRSLYTQNCRIILLNGSLDCVRHHFHEFPNITYEHKFLNDRFNKGKLMNYAVRHHVTTPYFIFSDADLIYRNDYIQKMREFIPPEGHAPVRVVPFNYNLDSENYSHDFEFMKKFPKSQGGGAHGNGLVHLESFKAIRGVSTRYYGYGPEDAQVNFRLGNYGNQLVYTKEVETLHLWHTPSWINNPNKDYNDRIYQEDMQSKIIYDNDENWGNY